MIGFTGNTDHRHPLYSRRSRQEPLRSLLIGCILLLQLICDRGFAVSGVLAFTTTSPSFHKVTTKRINGIHHRCENSLPISGSFPALTRRSYSSSSSSSSLAMGISPATSRIGVSVPSQAQCEALGVREWPQQSKTGSWNERVAPENTLVRYVLEGTGSLDVCSDETQDDESPGTKQSIAVKPGTLVEIQPGTPAVRLEWKCDGEIVLLTPGFEEGNVFLGVIAGIVLLFGALLSGALG